MSSKGLVEDVKALRRAMVWMVVLIVAVGSVIFLNLVPGKRSVEEEPVTETVSDALAVATVNNCAALEAGRIVKMAAILMDMGGEYTASCKSVYNPAVDKVEAKYSITWYRKTEAPVETDPMKIQIGPDVISREWKGTNWGECLAKMAKWKQAK